MSLSWFHENRARKEEERGKMEWEEAVEQVSDALKVLPLSVWETIVKRGAAYREMNTLALRYPSGVFLTLMVVVGLNDYQLKGKAEVAYWPPLRRHLDALHVPDSLKDLERILEPFYQKERLNNIKVNRLRRFLKSSLARRLWNMTPKEAAKQLRGIWREIALVMIQKSSDKTIAFAAKTLAIGLLLLNETGFDFSGIPVPVDSRVRDLTPSLNDDHRVRQFWDDTLERLRETEPNLTHLHLDSLLWQYGGATNRRLYLIDLGIGEATAAKIEQIFHNLGALRRD